MVNERYFWILIVVFLTIRLILYFMSPSPFKDGDKIRITNQVTSEPIRYSDSQYLRLKGLKIYLPLYPEVSYGDRIVVEGVVDKDKLSDVTLIEIKENQGSLFRIRKRLLEVYNKALPRIDAALISGVTIGSKASIPRDFWESLKLSGTAHVVVASGMNVTLVAGFLMSFFVGILPRRRAIPIVLIGVWLYSVMSGFDAPIVRAAIMSSIAFTAQELGKLYIAFRALIICAILMLFFKPEWLTDLGFILSFMATGSLMLFEPFISRKIRYVPSIFKEGLSTSLAAQIGVAPVLYYTFGQFNYLSPLVNAAVLWTIAPMTVIGLIGGIVGLLFFPFGKIILLLSYPLTSWFVFIVKYAG